MALRIWLLGITGILCGLTLRAGGATSESIPSCNSSSNVNCAECLRNVSCLWCNSNKKCFDYPVKKILPPKSLCPLSDARWGVCWVNFEALIIAMSVVGGVLILSVCVCCCCCCCRRRKSKQHDGVDQKLEREKEQRRMRQEERKSEMKIRHDEIRKKYGLFNEPNSYTRFENN
ncbi:pituitary tumor-transforming gene 1 protein-interacting protein-like [Pristis pectinata]|uniref:pituitary tumor-transforming gene 1 protein-interacting protein-like n=1 Tax=Pristis pectinata TaxID=685728 RepID=UPI00223E0D08|nr:pituitary tumor-transforming gene 1 protein-interacting protein-like [Pristis pectinata]